MPSITSIHLNGSDYTEWDQVVEIFIFGRKKNLSWSSKYADWRVENVQILNCLHNSVD